MDMRTANREPPPDWPFLIFTALLSLRQSNRYFIGLSFYCRGYHSFIVFSLRPSERYWPDTFQVYTNSIQRDKIKYTYRHMLETAKIGRRIWLWMTN